MKNGLIVDEDGSKYWYLNDELHSVDGPAIVYVNGAKYWYVHGKKHRVDGPAEELADGTKRWFLNGKLHRVDGPAIVWANSEKRWFLKGEQLIHPDEFKTMEEFIEKMNTDEEYSLQWINDVNGIIEYITNPTNKQKRLNAMKWKL